MKDFANGDFKTFTIKVPYSLDDNSKDILIDLIKSNLDKINKDETIKYEDNKNKLNPLYIYVYSLKNYYMVSTLLNLISTIHINLGMTYYEEPNQQQNQQQNQQNIRR
jgi:hypothetical protein